MKNIAFLTVLAACSPSVEPFPTIQNTDAAVDVPSDAGMAMSTDAGLDAGPLLWSGANLVLATAYCELGVRCGTGDYTFLYGSGSSALTDCIAFNNEALCYSEWEGIQMCESVYPTERYQNLANCPSDSANVDCEDGDLYWVTSCNLAAPWAQGS
jgi:hypothetical protein